MTRAVQLSDEAYRRLAMMKRPGQSFSDVVLRLTRPGSLAGLSNLGRSKAEIRGHKQEFQRISAMDRT